MNSDRQFHFDLDRYTRTHGLFDAKRARLAPEAIELLAREVVERLAAARIGDDGGNSASVEPTINPDLVDTFCDILLKQDAYSASQFLQDDLSPVATDRTALYGYIAAASRQLGARWDADEVTFAEVTLSVSKLYALVRSIGLGRSGQAVNRNLRKSALFASVPGEQHTLGVTIAAEMFRDAGWDIDLQVDRSHHELLARARQTNPSVIGLSLSSAAGLDALARLVVSLRLTLPSSLLAVAPGAETNAQMLRTTVDIDLVITDAKRAQSDLDRLLRLQPDA
jgi:methanogenic corrinoid protein MtbC1